MSIIKNIAVRILPIAVMAFFVVAAIAYQRGVYDITFIERTTTADTGAVTPPEDTAPPADTSSQDPSDTTIPEDTAPPEDTSAPEPDAISEFLNTLPSTASLLAAGRTITDYDYTEAMLLSHLETSVSIPNSFTLRTKEILVPEQIPEEVYSGYTTIYNTVTVDRPLVEMYMDYIVIDNGSTVTLLENNANIITTGFDIETYQPAYTRDLDDIPQFKTVTPPKNKNGRETVDYFMFNAKGEFVKSTYDDTADGRGLYFNYPKNFGKTDDPNYTRFYANGLYTYGYANGRFRITPRYTKAYSYSEGRAAVIDEEGQLTFLNTVFGKAINGYRIYANEMKRYVISSYRAPDSNGIESLGFYYFDHGLVRVRKREIDHFHWTDNDRKDLRTVTDEYIVIRSDGSVYPTPSGYTVKAYSCGVFLLEKDGYYGFMDYTGRWIAHPVYTYAEPFVEGLAVVAADGRCGMIDTEGEFRIPMLFDYVGSASGGVITAYEKEHGWMLFNKIAPEETNEK